MNSLMNRGSLLAATSTIALALGVGSSAFAQVGSAPAAAPASATAAPVTTLEDVVVTAQRRSENIQRVPIAIAAVSGENLTNQGINDTQALVKAVPGLNINTYAGNTLVTIRGVGTTALAVENDVGVYVDGVNVTSSAASLLNLSNIDHVEVLKGPQGTLFGRNSIGGAIQIVTRTPSGDPSADISVGIANYSTYQANFYGTTGIGEKLAVDFAAYYSDQADGWGRNLTTGKDIFKSTSLNIRNKWVYNLSDDTKITLSADYAHDKNQAGLQWSILPGSIGFGGTKNAGFYNALGDGKSQIDATQWGGAFRVDHDFGWARGVSLTGYRRSENENAIDQDATPFPVVEGNPTPQNDKAWSQEFQLLSPSDQENFKWILGAYYLDDLYYTPGFNVQIGPNHVEYVVDMPTKSAAAYAQATIEVLPKTHLTGGVRYTHDDKSITGVTYFNGGPSPKADQSKVFSKVTYRAVLDYQLTPTVLAYVSYDTGFKSGQFNLIHPEAPAIEPESLDALQAGVKSELFSRRLRLNTSAFHYDYTNIQIASIVGGGTQLLNAAQAEIYGADLDFKGVVTSNFSIQGSLSLLHGRYTNFPNAPSYVPTGVGANRLVAIPNARGNKTVQSPPVTAVLGGDYVVPLQGGELELSANVTYNSGYYWDPDNRLKQPSYSLLGAFAKWTPAGGKYDVRVWGNNITGTKHYALETAFALGDVSSPAAPATYGATLNIHF